MPLRQRQPSEHSVEPVAASSDDANDDNVSSDLDRSQLGEATHQHIKYLFLDQIDAFTRYDIEHLQFEFAKPNIAVLKVNTANLSATEK